jgi:putative inorganic carbon (HCO3(-)) transporter
VHGKLSRYRMGLAVVLVYIALNLLSPGDLFPDLRQYRPTLILALASLPLAALARLRQPEIGKLRIQFILVILFFGWAICSWFPHGGLGANVRTLLELSSNVIVYFVGIILFGSPIRLSFLRTTLVLVAIFVLINALWGIPYARASGLTTPYDLTNQHDATVEPGLMAEQAPGSANSENVRIRGLGMLNDPNVLGQFLLMILPMLYVSTKDTGMGSGYVLAIPITILFLVGVYYTGSRGAEVGVAALIALFLIARYKTIGAVLSGIVGALLLLVVNLTRNRTITMSQGMDRLAIWSDGMSYFKSQPIWGIGWGSFADRQGMTAHNSFLLCAAELGFVGYFLWMSIIVVTMIQLSRIPKLIGAKNPAMVRWALAVRASLGVYLFTGFFLSRAYEMPLFLLFGMAGAIIAAVGGDDAIPLRGTGWPVWSLALCAGVLALIYAMLRLRMV